MNETELSDPIQQEGTSNVQMHRFDKADGSAPTSKNPPPQERVRFLHASTGFEQVADNDHLNVSGDRLISPDLITRHHDPVQL